MIIENDSSTDAKADVDKEECNKLENPGNRDQENEKNVSVQESMTKKIRNNCRHIPLI